MSRLLIFMVLLAMGLTALTVLIFRKYQLHPLSKKHFLIIGFWAIILNLIAAHLTAIAMPTGLFMEHSSTAALVYASFGGWGLYVKSLFMSVGFLGFLYCMKFLTRIKILDWDAMLLLIFYLNLLDVIVDSYGLFLARSLALI